MNIIKMEADWEDKKWEIDSTSNLHLHNGLIYIYLNDLGPTTSLSGSTIQQNCTH